MALNAQPEELKRTGFGAGRLSVQENIARKHDLGREDAQVSARLLRRHHAADLQRRGAPVSGCHSTSGAC